MIDIRTSSRALLLLGAGLAALASPAAAQDTAPPAEESAAPAGVSDLGDIVVTARRREESLLDVPIAITSFSGATLEGIAFQIYELAEAMKAETGQQMPTFKVDGGAVANDLLMQFQSDLLGVPIERPRMVETTALGAAFLAGLAVGVWKSRDEIRKSWKVDKRFQPKMSTEDREAHLGKWRRAVANA